MKGLPHTLDELRECAIPVLKQHGVARAGFFGSRVRGDHRNDSDLDVVIERPANFSLYDLIRLQFALSDALGIQAHVSTYSSLHPLMRDDILSEEAAVLR